MHVNTVTRGDQKRVMEPVELELWATVSHLMWVLDIELRADTKAGNYPNDHMMKTVLAGCSHDILCLLLHPNT